MSNHGPSHQGLNQAERLIKAYRVGNFEEGLFYKFLNNYAPNAKPKPPHPPILCAIYSGGGVRVTAFTGGNSVIEEQGIYDDIERVIGASGGGLIALLEALGFSPTHVVYALHHLNVMDMADKRDSYLGDYFASTTFAKMLGALVIGHIHDGTQLRNWAKSLIEHALGNPDATFANFQKARQSNPALKELYLVVARLKPLPEQSREVVLGADSFPDVKLIDAFCATTAYTPVFPPVFIDGVGLCHDGGFVNNFPVDKADHPEFTHPNYPLQAVRFKDLAFTHLYNPSAICFTLVSELRNLDPSITPLSRELEERLDASPKVEVEDLQLYRTWSYRDLLKATIYCLYGKPTIECEQRKAQTHPRTTVQIYDEEIGTLELDFSAEKRQTIMQGGVKATRAWFKRFRDPSKTYEGTYIEKFAVPANKQDNPHLYYTLKLKKLIDELMKEVMRCVSVLGYIENNARIAFFAYHIKHLVEKKGCVDVDFTECIKSAWEQSALEWSVREQLIKQHRAHMEILVKPQELLNHLRQLLLSNDKDDELKFKRILTGQISHVLDLCLIKTPSLIGLAAISKPSMLPFLFDLIRKICEQRNQQSSDIYHDFVLFLNDLPAVPLLYYANQSQGGVSVSLCLNAGCDPFKEYELKSPIQYALEGGHFEAFIEYLSFMREKGYKAPTLWHHVVAHFGTHNVERLYEAKYEEALKFLITQSVPNEAGVTAFEQVTLLKDPSLWRRLMDRFNPDSKDTYTQNRGLRESKEKIFETSLMSEDNLEPPLNADAPSILLSYHSERETDETEQNLSTQMNKLSVSKH